MAEAVTADAMALCIKVYSAASYLDRERCRWVMSRPWYDRLRAACLTEDQEQARAAAHISAGMTVPVADLINPPYACPARCGSGPFATMADLAAHLTVMADPEYREPAEGDCLFAIPIDVRDDGGEPHLERPLPWRAPCRSAAHGHANAGPGPPHSGATAASTRPNGNAASPGTGPVTGAPMAASRCGGGRWPWPAATWTSRTPQTAAGIFRGSAAGLITEARARPGETGCADGSGRGHRRGSGDLDSPDRVRPGHLDPGRVALADPAQMSPRHWQSR